jgi:hypothetical protein
VRDVEEGWNVADQEPTSEEGGNSIDDVEGSCSPDPGPAKEDEVGAPRGQLGVNEPDENEEEELKNEELAVSLVEIGWAVGGEEVDPSSIVDEGDTLWVGAGAAVG